MGLKKQKILAFFIPIVLLLFMIASPIVTILAGDEIRLKTIPIDPRDLFRGDYVILGFEAESVPISKIDSEIIDHYREMKRDYSDYVSGELEVYSVLKDVGQSIYDVEKVVKNKPNDGLFLKGTIRYIDFNQYEKNEMTVMVDYGLDQYFVPENTGQELEEAIQENDGSVFATIKVRNGKGILTSVDIHR